MLRLLLLPLALVALTTSNLFAQQGPSNAVRTELQTFARAYIDAHNRADATALMEMVKRGPAATSVSDGEITRGWDAIRTQTDEIAGLHGAFTIALGTMDVTALGANHSLIVAPITINIATDQGTVQTRGAMTLVLERIQGEWRIINEHYSTRPN